MTFMSRISYSQLVPKSIKIVSDGPKWVSLLITQ